MKHDYGTPTEADDNGQYQSDIDWEVGVLGDQFESYALLAGESLLNPDLTIWQTYVDRIGPENVRVVRRSGTPPAPLAGGLAFYRMAQWYGGRPVTTAGFSGVAIDPAQRGSGACAAMLRNVLSELRDEGMPLASLFASTQSLYRSVGFGQAGTRYQYSIPMASMPRPNRTLRIQRFESPPIELLEQVACQQAARMNGHLTRTDGLWRRLTHPYDGAKVRAYVVFDDCEADSVDGVPVGYVLLRQGTREGGFPQPLVATDICGLTGGAIRRLLTLVQDFRSSCDSFHWNGGPHDELLLYTSEQSVEVTSVMRWMARIIDLPAAFEARGYPAGCKEQLNFEITDSILPQNSGRWRIEIRDGQAHVSAGGNGTINASIDTLATLYTGFYSPRQLFQLGELGAAPESQIDSLQRVFAGPSPWVSELY